MIYEAVMEESYKKGYAKGYADGKYDSAKRGYWIIHGTRESAWAECSECHICGSPQWKVCPVCETKMDGGSGDA